jgi:hypothetical protein
VEERANKIPFIDHTGDEAPALEPSLVEAANNSTMPLSLIRSPLDPEASVTVVELDQISQAMTQSNLMSIDFAAVTSSSKLYIIIEAFVYELY